MKIIIFLLPFLLLACNISSDKNPETAVRGIWITNVNSNVLSSRPNIIQALNLCSESGINTVFPVVWNNGRTYYPSAVMRDLTGIEISPVYTGRDPLRELIEEASRRNIKVIPWFEYGFSSSYNLDGGDIINIKPDWAARDIAGNLIKKNGFEWMNAFDPEIQDFMLSIIMEVVRNYNVDGIMGDDRLPAMPSEAGYDSYTVELYKSQHNGNSPPGNPKDSAWIQWRADILSGFMRELYDSVKTFNSSLIVTCAPGLYPWSKIEYLQDWPRWVNEGLVDLLIPQIYRYELNGYVSELDKIINEQIDENKLHRLYPGILLRVGNYFPSEGLLRRIIEENRVREIYGEVFFYYEGLNRFSDLFRTVFYNDHTGFPVLTADK